MPGKLDARDCVMWGGRRWRYRKRPHALLLQWDCVTARQEPTATAVKVVIRIVQIAVAEHPPQLCVRAEAAALLAVGQAAVSLGGLAVIELLCPRRRGPSTAIVRVPRTVVQRVAGKAVVAAAWNIVHPLEKCFDVSGCHCS
jgi:hypothetical protein